MRRSVLRLTPLALVAIGVVWVAALGFGTGVLHTGVIDLAWDAFQATTSTPAAHAVAGVLAVIGTGVPAVASVLLVAALAWRRRGRGVGLGVLLIAGVSQLGVTTMKLVAGRVRPDPAYGWHTSFPSGHTTLAALLATLVALLLLERWWRLAAAAWPLLMAWSRTELHAHWLTDVLAGCVLGGATAVALTAATCAALGRIRRARPRAAAPQEAAHLRSFER